MNNPIKMWLSANHISYRQLATAMGQSPASISLKVNGQVGWNRNDLKFLKQRYGLSADFVLGFKTGDTTTGELPAIRKEACA
ncbi:XRE family transcriptional regulator [Bifidobacterium margollesii]|uniref:XRE family transcriptional regulator n=1 Tax=Bifidobacterium margollesii TaxID=2020964 RepID=A0A2N5J617_9BIFI|nr:helix-turn-helix transcriptional regulator [Bifidobacterium margollesii]PLS29652.1 XRE family transcriptional regulator [Bifidobacterium margollesii]